MQKNKQRFFLISGVVLLLLLVLVIRAYGFSNLVDRTSTSLGVKEEWKTVDCDVTVDNPWFGSSQFTTVACTSSQPITRLSCPSTLTELFLGIGAEDLEVKMIVGGQQAGATKSFTLDAGNSDTIKYRGCVRDYHKQVAFQLIRQDVGQVDYRLVDIV